MDKLDLWNLSFALHLISIYLPMKVQANILEQSKIKAPDKI